MISPGHGISASPVYHFEAKRPTIPSAPFSERLVLVSGRELMDVPDEWERFGPGRKIATAARRE